MTSLSWLLIFAYTILSIPSAIHALIYKKDPRAAFGWIAVCLMFPPGGPLLYLLFGINRIKTKADKLNMSPAKPTRSNHRVGEGEIPLRFITLAQTSFAVSGLPLTQGNSLQILHNGDNAYPLMLDSINRASKYIFFSTYIFENNQTGQEFIKALARAQKRGVRIRVLVDGVGQYYTWPLIKKLFEKYELELSFFLPPKLIPPSLLINLRNHRKILVIDGVEAYTGGMNIGDRHIGQKKVIDMHFKLKGPIIFQMEGIFLRDWMFVTGEEVHLKPVALPKLPENSALCRALEGGPHHEENKLGMILVSAISAARQKIFIMTPYFIPPRELIGALQAAALRGVKVSIILPAKNNFPFMTWATNNLLWELLQKGIRVFMQPGPFAHTKLFTVDGHYAQIGSANIDSRSLRLNFEMNIEIYNKRFTSHLDEICQQIIQNKSTKQITLKDVDGRSLAVRIRDSLCWLFSPYL